MIDLGRIKILEECFLFNIPFLTPNLQTGGHLLQKGIKYQFSRYIAFRKLRF